MKKHKKEKFFAVGKLEEEVGLGKDGLKLLCN